MSIRAGVLILGSLYWDNADRERWRRERLDIAAAQKVWLPIRYGRLSGEQRGHTHTMMLSRLCYAHRELGVAYVVPCSHSIGSAEDLLAEAHELAAAERLNKWTWGAVGVLTNPNSEVLVEIVATWKTHAAARLSMCDLFTHHPKSELPIISKAGILRMRWPLRVDNGMPAELDILLATPTALRDVGQYPKPKQIGETYVRQDRPEYFVENVRHGLRTAQDRAIWKSAVRLKPEWAAQYADIGKALGLA